MNTKTHKNTGGDIGTDKNELTLQQQQPLDMMTSDFLVGVLEF